jgi:hypothetical protein
MTEERKVPELTDLHKRWIVKLEEDFPHLPLGYARAMVELYLMDPSFFEKDNVLHLCRQPAPKLARSHGTIRVVSGAEAERLGASMEASCGRAELQETPEENT